MRAGQGGWAKGRYGRGNERGRSVGDTGRLRSEEGVVSLQLVLLRWDRCEGGSLVLHRPH